MLNLEVICTGNELLDGTTADTNTQRLANIIQPLGLKITRVTVVPDDRGVIAQVARDAVKRSEIVIFSGGLGPTSDDLTVEAVAEAFGIKMVYSKSAERNIRQRLKTLRRELLNPSNLKQALIPVGAVVLSNREGTAPALRCRLANTTAFFLPGVPREFQYVLVHHVEPWFRKLSHAKDRRFIYVLKTFGWAESELNELLKRARIPKGVTIGFRTAMPENHIKLIVQAASRHAAQRKTRPIVTFLKKHLGSACFAEGDATFEKAVVASLLKQGVRVAVAESCTGGLIAALLTRVAGVSEVLDRGFVVYSNEAKAELLGVNPETLAKHGSVNEAVAVEMALGALAASKADRAVAVTGIAGPGGGTRSKPVGTIWIAAASRSGQLVVKTRQLSLSWDRELNQKVAAYVALKMLKEI